jgi:L,D-peptidoglycan transpeptidase YkuD (ErfK/YbiS/YcfS/YnhG family)
MAMIDESRSSGWQKTVRLAGVVLLLSGCGATVTESGPTTTRAVPTHVVAPPSTTPVTCARNLPARLASTGGATQLITVQPGAGATVASVTLWQRVGRCWTSAGGPWTGWIGRSGFSDHHREGDGTTPTGIYRLERQVYGNAPNPGTRLPYHQLVCGDWWDEDPTSPAYNSFQHVTCGKTPAFAGDSEALWTAPAPYPSFAVVDYNARPIVPFAGSAIFIHADIGVPTNGCVSIPLSDLEQLLRWLNPAAAAAIVMGPSSEIARF